MSFKGYGLVYKERNNLIPVFVDDRDGDILEVLIFRRKKDLFSAVGKNLLYGENIVKVNLQCISEFNYSDYDDIKDLNDILELFKNAPKIDDFDGSRYIQIPETLVNKIAEILIFLEK